MEAEHWVAVTVAALLAGSWGCLLLSVAGFGFFTYINLRYGAHGTFAGRAALVWWGGILGTGRLEGALLVPVLTVMLLRTITLSKWGWISGKPW